MKKRILYVDIQKGQRLIAIASTRTTDGQILQEKTY